MGLLKEIIEDITGQSSRPQIKGNRFEKFISEQVFTDILFDLVEMTQSWESNSDRFEERSLNPDFKFRDKRTGETFWVEAKFRSSTFINSRNQEVCEICTQVQLKRYQDVEKSTGYKVYICLGLGGDPQYPQTIHLIPVATAYSQLFISRLKETLLWEDKDGYKT